MGNKASNSAGNIDWQCDCELLRGMWLVQAWDGSLFSLVTTASPLPPLHPLPSLCLTLLLLLQYCTTASVNCLSPHSQKITDRLDIPLWSFCGQNAYYSVNTTLSASHPKISAVILIPLIPHLSHLWVFFVLQLFSSWDDAFSSSCSCTPSPALLDLKDPHTDIIMLDLNGTLPLCSPHPPHSACSQPHLDPAPCCVMSRPHGSTSWTGALSSCTASTIWSCICLGMTMWSLLLYEFMTFPTLQHHSIRDNIPPWGKSHARGIQHMSNNQCHKISIPQDLSITLMLEPLPSGDLTPEPINHGLLADTQTPQQVHLLRPTLNHRKCHNTLWLILLTPKHMRLGHIMWLITCLLRICSVIHCEPSVSLCQH